MYKGKDKIFDSFCWHYDDTETLPEKTDVLASNKKSKVQAIHFAKEKSIVWAVQYHPEFDPLWISGLMNQRKKILLNSKIFTNKNQYYSYKNFFSNIEKYSYQKKDLNISDQLINEKMHSLELYNWLNSFKD